jgi:hypothetical protein
VDAEVAGEFRVEGSDQVTALFGKDRVVVVGCEDFDAGPTADDGGADEDRFEGSPSSEWQSDRALESNWRP